MIRIRDTLIPIDSIMEIALMYDNQNDNHVLMVRTDVVRTFAVLSREQGEQELEQIREAYTSVVWGD